ncbi:glycosyltransferase [bacterium]|jgi:glycosyltransferase involved in cell wall biosynthesis|nr:glycosyltransferase [bacterium]
MPLDIAFNDYNSLTLLLKNKLFNGQLLLFPKLSMHKKKILFVIHSFIGGGAERVFINILKNIDRDVFDIELAVGEYTGELIFDIPKDIKIYELNAKRSYKAIIPLIKLVRGLKPDLVFSNVGFGVSSSFASFLFPKRTKLIVRLGNTLSAHLDDVKQNFGLLYYYYYFILNRSIFYFSDVVIVQSDYMRKDILRIYNLHNRYAEKIIKIRNPIDHKNILRLSKSNSSIDIFSNFSNKSPKIVSVGRIAYQKGYDFLIKSFVGVVKEYPNIRLVVIGEGDMRSEIEGMVDRYNLNDNIDILGFKKNPYCVIAKSDIFISSSRYEGFSNAIIESLALGVPVVATDCPSGIREVLNDGVNGWLSPMYPNTVENLSNTILKSIREYQSLSMKKERLKVIKDYNVESIVLEYENFFLNLIETFE